MLSASIRGVGFRVALLQVWRVLFGGLAVLDPTSPKTLNPNALNPLKKKKDLSVSLRQLELVDEDIFHLLAVLSMPGLEGTSTPNPKLLSDHPR